MIKFPTKKYSKSNEYFADYINIKDLLLKKVDQKILLKIIQMISIEAIVEILDQKIQ